MALVEEHHTDGDIPPHHSLLSDKAIMRHMKKGEFI